MNPPISPDKLTDARGSVVQSTSFDAWGRRRNPSNWTYSHIPATLFNRGYTGHSLPRPLGEHLDLFGLINMNGRMYDPILARFLSVDPYVQAADYTQSYNRYSYCWNNPLAYTDPTGYLRGDPEKRFIEDLYPIPVVDGKGGGLLYDGFDDLSSFTHNGIWQKYGVGLGREAGPIYEEWVASQTQVYTGVQKIIISGKFIYIHSSPSPKNLISNRQMLYNGNYGIYIQRDVTTGAFYQPYSDQVVNPSELLAGAIVGGWGLEGAAGDAGDQSWILGPRGVDWGSSMKNIAAWGREMDDHFKYGKPGSERRKTGQPPKMVKAIISPIISLPNAAAKIYSGKDIYGIKVSGAQRWIGAPISAALFLFPTQITTYLDIPEGSVYILDPLINKSLE